MSEQPLHLEYRPRTFDEVVGNEGVVTSLKSILERDEGRPHSFLFSGPSGCGKTTLARIIKSELKCSDRDFSELNMANTRGIEAIREMVVNSKYSPVKGSCKIYLLDECFAKGSFVNTPSGSKKIENIQKGDSVYSLSGVDKVSNTFVNKVVLDRVVKLRFSNGSVVHSTKEHLFFTNDGWKKSIDLQTNDLIFGFDSDLLKESNQSGWNQSRIEKSYIVRSKENEKVERVRVESIEVYKRGGNERSFQSIIGDKERNQGFVEFYDLEVENHPSYFVNNLPVHNCHKLTSDAQHAVLKILEDTPKHVYFILCTTEPERLLNTIRTRCTKFQVSSLTKRKLSSLIKFVLEEENIEGISDKVVSEIVKVSEGSPRNALVLLDSVIDLSSEEEMISTVVDFSVKKEVVIDLCRGLLEGKSWKTIGKILSGIDDEPEKVRYAVLGWMNTVLLKSENDRAALVITNFLDSFMYTGKAGLTLACYLTVTG